MKLSPQLCSAVAGTFVLATMAVGGAGDCCVANGTPGCDDAKCEASVCSADPFCCDVAWDDICAGTAAAFCTELCGGGGTCPPSDHDCFTTGGPGCTDIECCQIVCASDPFCCDVAWDGLCVGGAQTLCGADPLDNDDCADAIAIGLGDTTFSTIGATTDGPPLPPACDKGFGLALVNDIWYVFTGTEDDILNVSTCNQASYDTRLAAYTGDCSNLTLVACNDDAPGCAGFTSLMQIPTSVGVDYLIRVGGFGTSGTGTLSLFYGDPGPGGCGNPDAGDCFVSNGSPFCDDEECCLTVCAFDPFCCDVTWDGICASGAAANCNLEPLDNDDCADAIEIFLGDSAFTTIGATTDGPALPAECDKGFGLSFVNDVWFVFTGTENDILSVSTCNQASFDTRLAAYTGDCGNLTLVACNDDGPGCAGFTSLMLILTSVGEDYLIRVGGFGTSGTGTLSLFYGDEPGLANDNCEDAIVIGDGVTAFTTVGATTDGPPLPPECDKGFGLSFVNDVWFSYTASCDGLITASTCDSASFDTRLAAYTGSCGALTLVACNDDGPGCSGFTSIMEWEGTCGVEYLIRVGGFASSGTGQLNVSCDGECKAPGCAEDLTGDGVVDGADLGQLLNAWGPCPGCPEDLTGDGVVDGADLGQLLNAWGDC